MKIVSFGHIPSWAGGRQSSGLANVIYQLAKNMADHKEVQMTMAATDVFSPLKQDGNLTIYGWTKGLLLKYALKHPIMSVKWLASLLNAKKKYGPTVSLIGFFFKGLHLARTIEKTKPEVVHLHGMTACVYGKIVPSSVKIIVTMHGIIGLDKTIARQTYRYKMEQDVCRSGRYSLMCFIAEKLISDFRTLYGEIKSPCKAILNAYDSKSFFYIEPRKQDKLTLLTIASLSENKGQMRVLQAISDADVDCRYVCIGAGSDELIRQCKNYAVVHNIDYEYVGKKTPSEIREFMSFADYMILPSSTEGFGLVYLEAIACGVPVVLPKHLPIVHQKNIIQPDINSVLIEDSSVESIARILPNLPNMHFDRNSVANSIIDYSWIGIAKQYVESIKQIL